MTEETTQALLPCPFCGGEALRFTLPEDGLGNGGGDVITCTRCQASSHVEFGRKENLVDRWNTRLAHSLPSQADAGEEMLREVLVDHFPTGLRGSYERTAGGIVVDTGMKTDCHCGWSAQASDEHEVRDLWARHVAATLTAPPTSGEEMRLRDALAALLTRDMRNTCQHENTHRGGSIWEICDDCGWKWADDEGGKPEWQDPPEWVEARAALTKGAE